jgi:hypothetical protein
VPRARERSRLCLHPLRTLITRVIGCCIRPAREHDESDIRQAAHCASGGVGAAGGIQAHRPPAARSQRPPDARSSRCVSTSPRERRFPSTRIRANRLGQRAANSSTFVVPATPARQRTYENKPQHKEVLAPATTSSRTIRTGERLCACISRSYGSKSLPRRLSVFRRGETLRLFNRRVSSSCFEGQIPKGEHHDTRHCYTTTQREGS